MRISDTAYTPKVSLDNLLFPEIQPFNESYLHVSDLHRLWYAQYGNPHGVPIIVLHGGPGAGCSPIDMRYFDPNYYHIILLDQRGANRSEPPAEILQNSTPNLISDIEALRKHLTIQKWFVFGGSWGSTLAILYGEAFPEHCLGFILRGIYLARQTDISHGWYGLQDIYPELWNEFQKYLPVQERDDLINGYYERLINPDPKIHLPASQALAKYMLGCSYLFPTKEIINKFLDDETKALGIARLYTTFCKNHFYIEENQLLNNLSRIHHLPAIIVHGRYDVLCKAKSAYELHQNWPGSELIFVQDAGHSALDIGITKTLVEATEMMKIFKNHSLPSS